MRFFNCSIQEAAQRFEGKKIIPFGLGAWFNFLQYTELSALDSQFVYAVDNNPKSCSVQFCKRGLPVQRTDALLNEKNSVVLLTSPVYMYDMYMQLCEMKLDDSVECCAFPFMQLVSNVASDPKLEKEVQYSNRPQQIPKIIHSFWFSGDEKPESYQRCVNTWHEICPDYEIIEWTKDNYDYNKHPFCKAAVDLGLWAVASDFARLDIIDRMGGIYLDMDVELLGTLNPFLCNDAIFSFANNVNVDMAIFGAKRDNILVKKLLKLYDDIKPPKERSEYNRFFQPSLVADSFYKLGLKFNGSLQKIGKAVFFPKDYFMAFDAVMGLVAKNEHMRAIHWDNYGWYYGITDARKKKAENNRKLWDLVCK